MRSTTIQKKLRRAALEGLETRRLFNNSYHDLSSGLFFQDWSSTGQITTSDDWTNVPSIIGYRGDDITTLSGIDPQTLIAFAGPGGPVVDVNANQTNPTTFTSGGVTEFEIANSTVAFQGSGTSDAPFLLLHMNTTGQTNVPMSFNLRDIDANTDATQAVQPVAVQYRIGESGDFTNIPGAFTANAASPTSGNDTLVTAVSLNLPSACDNQAQVQIRIMTTNAVGNDQMIGVDDISVGTGVVQGTLALSAGNYNVAENVVGGQVTVTINRTGSVNGTASVRLQTSNGTAAEPGDYTAVDQIVNFADQQASATVNITINNDIDPENLETINLTLSQATGATLGLPSTGTVSIIDNDSSAPAVLMNEVEADPPVTDNPYEYVEIRSVSGGVISLANTYFISVEGDGGTTGFADVVIPLGSESTGSNGLLVIKSPTSGHSVGSTPTVTSALFDQSGGILENGSNSFILVFSQIPITVATDLDLNDDGLIDNLPLGALMIDGVGWVDGDAGDQAYGAILTQGAGQPPGAASRFPSNTAVNDANAWYNGDVADTGGGNTSLGYNPGAASANLPAGAVLTPGAANFDTGNTPPTVDASSFNFDTSPNPMNLQLDFSEAMNQSTLIAGTTITLQNLDNLSFIPGGNMSLNYGAGDVLTITFSGLANSVPTALPNGNYRLTATTAVQDSGGAGLASNYTLDLYYLNGDATRTLPKAVNSADFNVLATNFGATSGKVVTTGDFTFDGAANSADFNVLASNFGATLAGDGARDSIRPGGGSNGGNGSIFGDGHTIGDDDDSILA